MDSNTKVAQDAPAATEPPDVLTVAIEKAKERRDQLTGAEHDELHGAISVACYIDGYAYEGRHDSPGVRLAVAKALEFLTPQVSA